jgi:hypoxanthine phosphoribosyltransferase
VSSSDPGLGLELLSEEQLRERVGRLAREISRDYRDRVPILVGVSISSATFLADLARALTIDCRLELIMLRQASDPGGLGFENDLTVSIEDRDVIVVAGIVGTGATLRYLVQTLEGRNPRSLTVCLLLNRVEAALPEAWIKYAGFEIPPGQVTGYGLDRDGRHRELPSVYHACSLGAGP